MSILSWVATWLGFGTGQDKSTSPENETFATPLREQLSLKDWADNYQTPEGALGTPELPNHLRFMVQRGQVVGVVNTVRKYQEHRPVTVHSTPFEKRVDDIMLQEKEAAPDLHLTPIQHLDLSKPV